MMVRTDNTGKITHRAWTETDWNVWLLGGTDPIHVVGETEQDVRQSVAYWSPESEITKIKKTGSRLVTEIV